MSSTVQSKDPPSNSLRVVVISDTHGKHRQLQLPEGDVLIHAGDFSQTGRLAALQDFASWLKKQPFKHKIVIAGNHDITLDKEFYRHEHNQKRWHKKLWFRNKFTTGIGQAYNVETCRKVIQECCTYLEDSSVTIDGIKIFGSPYQPDFNDWAFQYNDPIGSMRWIQVPSDVDILVTHGPAYNRLDQCQNGKSGGCRHLRKWINDQIKPQFHVFGHVHSAYGTLTDGTTTYINASSCNEDYQCVNKPQVFDIEKK